VSPERDHGRHGDPFCVLCEWPHRCFGLCLEMRVLWGGGSLRRGDAELACGGGGGGVLLVRASVKRRI